MDITMNQTILNWFKDLAITMAEHETDSVEISTESENYIFTIDITMSLKKKTEVDNG